MNVHAWLVLFTLHQGCQTDLWPGSSPWNTVVWPSVLTLGLNWPWLALCMGSAMWALQCTQGACPRQFGTCGMQTPCTARVQGWLEQALCVVQSWTSCHDVTCGTDPRTNAVNCAACQRWVPEWNPRVHIESGMGWWLGWESQMCLTPLLHIM